MDRRSFLKTATGTTVAAIAGLTHSGHVVAKEDNVIEKMPIGNNHANYEQMESRHLGGNLDVSAIGLGCSSLVGYQNGTPTKAKMAALISGAYDNGVTVFDVFQNSTSREKWIGEALKPIRHKIKIITNSSLAVPENVQETFNNRMHIRKSIESSLRQLGTDYIDLLYLPVEPNVPVEVVASVVKDLIQEGKVLNWGLSDASAQSIRQAHAVCPLAAVRNEYAIWWREPERKLFPTLEAYGIGFVPYGALGYGFLTGAVTRTSTLARDDFRHSLPQFEQKNLSHNLPLVSVVQEWSRKKGLTPAQFALVWMLSKKPWIVPVARTTNPAHLIELLGASIPRLTAWELEEFDRDVAKIEIMGQRQDSRFEI